MESWEGERKIVHGFGTRHPGGRKTPAKTGMESQSKRGKKFSLYCPYARSTEIESSSLRKMCRRSKRSGG
jgi:hypothetical protein